MGPGGLGLPDVVGEEPVVMYEDPGEGIVHCGRLGLLYKHHVLGVLRGFIFFMSFTAGLSRGTIIKGDSQLVVSSDHYVG